MHFVVDFATTLAGDQPWREQTRQTGRGGQHGTEQVQRRFTLAFRLPLAGDGPHVPDTGLLAVEIGGADKQSPSLVMGLGDRLQQVRVDEGFDQTVERRDRIQARAPSGQKAEQAQATLGQPAGEGVGQTVVPVGTEKGEGGDQGPGTDAGDHGKGRPSPNPGQADQ